MFIYALLDRLDSDLLQTGAPLCEGDYALPTLVGLCNHIDLQAAADGESPLRTRRASTRMPPLTSRCC